MTREIELLKVQNMTEESAWTTVVFLALFFHSIMQCMEYSTLSKFYFTTLSPHLEVEEAGMFHAYWAISSYGLCFCRCFLTGFDHKCSLPRNDFLLPLFNMVAHRGHAANIKVNCCKTNEVAANKKNSCCKLSDRKVCTHTYGKRRIQYSCIQGPLTKCLA